MSAHDETVEKVARAIWDVDAPDHRMEWDEETSAGKERYLCIARAAIAALGDGWRDIASDLAKALRRLAYHAQTSGGTAGRDDGLVAAVDIGLAALREYDAKTRAALPPPPGAKP